MTQILHIFKKDVRRYWPEIFISLALLVLYTRRQVEAAPEITGAGDIRLFFFFEMTRLVTPILVLFWAFLILRVVQDESLVGDRQWWVTKPYLWWQLLLAKLFFIFVFINVPLFFVQLFLLHHAGFSIVHNFRDLVLIQFTPLILIVFSLALASLTKSLAQALLGIGLALTILIACVWLGSHLSHNSYGESSKFMEALEFFFVFAPFIFVPLWQFARRKTWTSRGILVGSLAAAYLISFIPSASHLEQSYAPVAANDSPVHLTIPAIPELEKTPTAWPNNVPTVPLIIPVNVSGSAPGTVVLIDGINITADSPEDSRWSPGWFPQSLKVWPGEQRLNLSYSAKRKGYQAIKSKSLDLHIQLLFSEYQEADPRPLLMSPYGFQDTYLGTCGPSRLAPGLIECRKPFRPASYMARFDAPKFPCPPPRQYPSGTPTNLAVAYSLSASRDGFLPDPGLNPIIDYYIAFISVTPVPETEGKLQRADSVINVCPGAEIHLARPLLKRQFRMQLDLPNTRLDTLIQEFREGGATSWDLRSM
jgi:hypothetical protein